MELLLFARVGWMRLYSGPQPDDERPIGGGKYNEDSLGHEAYNFLPLEGKMLGYFQPQLQPPDRRISKPSSIALERIKTGFDGDSLCNVLTVFFATDPKEGRQRIVGWFRSSTVHRHAQESSDKRRECFSYYIEASEGNQTLVPESRREFILPGGKGGAGTANVCYTLESDGQPKQHSPWMSDALDYIHSYELEDAAKEPSSETDAAIAGSIASTLESSAGFQSNPRIRRAIEKYAMDCAEKHMKKLGYVPRDTHSNKPYDFICTIKGAEFFVEVKGMQDDGKEISLTPREVEHAKKHRNFILIIVHSVKVKGKRKPVASGGDLRFIHPWEIHQCVLKPRSFVLKVP